MTEDDEPLFHALYTDPETMRFIGPPWTLEEAAKYFRKILQRGGEPVSGGRCLVIVGDTVPDPLGICGSSHYDPVAMRLEVGMMLLPLGRKLGRGRGALAALVDYMFQESPAVEVYARFAAANTAARNVMARVGFRLEHVAGVEQHESTMCEWSILRSRWRIPNQINSRGK
jgi:RimJ/RimL family protein N-acetyltransferase